MLSNLLLVLFTTQVQPQPVTRDSCLDDKGSLRIPLPSTLNISVMTARSEIEDIVTKFYEDFVRTNKCSLNWIIKWRKYSYDIMPLDWRTQWFESDGSIFSICYFEEQDNYNFGLVPFDGPNSGVCQLAMTNKTVYGNFETLLVWHLSSQDLDTENVYLRESADYKRVNTEFMDNVQRLVNNYVTDLDRETFTMVVGTDIEYLLQLLRNGYHNKNNVDHDNVGDSDKLKFSYKYNLHFEMKKILTNERFFASYYNQFGLHLLRVILGYRILEKKQTLYGLKQHPYYEQWNKKGFLMLDVNDYLLIDNNSIIANDFLNILSLGNHQFNLNNLDFNLDSDRNWNNENDGNNNNNNNNNGSDNRFDFVKRFVIHEKNDEQYRLHVDTFHQSIKIWIYESNITINDGPLLIVPNSNKLTFARLNWLFNRTKNNPNDVIEEPSIRLHSNYNNQSFSDFQTASTTYMYDKNQLLHYGFQGWIPVLPIETNSNNNSDDTCNQVDYSPDDAYMNRITRKTLVIADTSSLHARGFADAGVKRIAYRPKGVVNDGGLPRLNPFELVD